MDGIGIEKIALPVLVTGANGFVGTHLVRRFISAGIRPRVLVLAGTPVPEEWGDKVDIVLGDISSSGDVNIAVSGCRTVLHLAALVTDWGKPDLHKKVTVGGTRHIFEAAATHRARVVLVSSVAVYGDLIARGPCSEDMSFGRPGGPYGWAKQQQEIIASEYRGTVDYAIVRPATVYGPGCQPWFHDLIAQLKSPFWPSLVGGGRNIAGLAQVENVVDVILMCAWHEQAVGEAFNASDDTDITWREYVSDLAEIVGSRPPTSSPVWLASVSAVVMEKVWGWLNIRSRPPVTREALTFVAVSNRYSMEKARSLLGYRPRVCYETGMQRIAVAVHHAGLGV